MPAEWTYTIRLGGVFHNEDMTADERHAAIARRIRSSRWFQNSQFGLELADLVDQLEVAKDSAEFDSVWSEIYDIADEDRAWIETR